MRKKLVQLCNLDQFICKDNKAVYNDGSLIISPGAKDEMSRMGIKLIRSNKTANSRTGKTGPLDNLDFYAEYQNLPPELKKVCTAISEVIKSQCSISNEKELIRATLEVVKKVKDQL